MPLPPIIADYFQEPFWLRPEWRPFEDALLNAPDAPGIYALGLPRGIRYDGGTSCIAYVGSAVNLQRRLSQHLPHRHNSNIWQLRQAFGELSVSWWLLPHFDQPWLLTVEGETICRFERQFGTIPVCNLAVQPTPHAKLLRDLVTIAECKAEQPISLDELKRLGFRVRPRFRPGNVKQSITAFTHLELSERGNNVFGVLRTAIGEFYEIYIFPKEHFCSFGLADAVPDDRLAPIEGGVILLLAAIVRDFWVVEEREKVFASRPAGPRDSRGTLPSDTPRIVYLPRVHYQERPNAPSCSENHGQLRPACDGTTNHFAGEPPRAEYGCRWCRRGAAPLGHRRRPEHLRRGDLPAEAETRWPRRGYVRNRTNSNSVRLSAVTATCCRGADSACPARPLETLQSHYASTNHLRGARHNMADSDFSFGGVSIPSSTKRLYVTAVLVPSTGDPRIQPTGFPDIGSVFYPDPSGEHGQICLIESEASMANRLEEVAFADKYTGTLVSELAGLPYIKIEKTEKGSNRFMTASTIDGHRFASEYIMKAKLKEASGEHHEHRPLPRRYHRRAHWLLWTIAQFAQSIALPFPSFGHSCHFGLGQFAAVDE